MGLSLGLDIAVKALRAHQLAVDVASHNIANVQSPGFSRQRVLLRPIGMDGSDHFSRDALLGRTGFGVDASDVNRVRDLFLDFQARQTMSSRGEYGSFSQPLSQAEVVFNDPSDDGISNLLGKFWAAWHDVVNDPESSAARTSLVHATTTLTSRLQTANAELTQQRADLNFQVGSIADQINGKAEELARLNLQVKQVELSGDKANDLRDRRDLLLDDLSKLGDIHYVEQPDTSVSVYLGSHELVVGTAARTVNQVQDPAQPGMTKLVYALDGDDVSVSSGQLKGVLDARDVALPDLLAKLNTFASGLIGSINTIHQAGFGLDNSTGLQFLTGTDASTIALNSVLAGSPQSIAAASGANKAGDGSIALAIANLQIAPTMIAGAAAANLVVNESLSAGNTATGLSISPTLQPGSYFITSPAPGTLELRYGSAAGAVVGTATLAPIGPGSGAITFVNGATTVATINVAAGGLYTAAQQEADLTAAGNNVISVQAAPGAYYDNIVSVLGADVNRARGLAESSGMLNDHLENMRQAVSGVNLDEEVTNLNASQKAYQAAARVITTIDEMLDTLINRTGVVGR